MNLQIQSSARVVEPSFRQGQDDSTPAQKRGLKYQAKVEEKLSLLYGESVLLRPWFRFKANWDIQYCQPDVILLLEDSSRAVVIEVKYATVSEAWKQLQRYKLVVEKAYRIPVSLALVTRMFDPARRFPCEITQLEGLDRLHLWTSEGLGVVSWKP